MMKAPKQVNCAEDRPKRKKTCKVEGCDEDLCLLRPYFLRVKICELHHSADQVLFKGQLHRFCQKCSRLEPLACFQGGRRSCQVKLQHHSKYVKRRRALAAVSTPVCCGAWPPAVRARLVARSSPAVAPAVAPICTWPEPTAMPCRAWPATLTRTRRLAPGRGR